jgi:hypothetical protein
LKNKGSRVSQHLKKCWLISQAAGLKWHFFRLFCRFSKISREKMKQSPGLNARFAGFKWPFAGLLLV